MVSALTHVLVTGGAGFEDGAQRHDFVHVSDVAQANLAALEANAEDEIGLRAYNVASGRPRTVGEMATALAARASRANAPTRTGSGPASPSWSPALVRPRR
jgi:nucleoside-diphosphate-sugar epimerase